MRCTCRWEAEHAGSRGPCKHALAVLLSLHE
ncbi:SWIM zinc finger family protein [Phycicoccus flavus]